MNQATFLIKEVNPTSFKNPKYTTVTGYFETEADAHQKAHDLAQCYRTVQVTCYIDGVENAFVAYHGHKTVYGE